ncbi:uncharacterized protein LOC122665404 [Telopea speciosissima]|uniref:uncharacterized protein LOC122665404 n=1 Tax=Telopea speciosissima TaxID=54955 RepID=UPI001CC3ED2D|nr:uncharacterized protein LOC122665404 [Telopea speciosissima]
MDDSQVSMVPASQPYFLHSSDQPGSSLVTRLLDGDNFPIWHRAMIMALEAKNKLAFIDGSLPKPDLISPDHSHWVRCNSMVRSWIVHSTVSSTAHCITLIDLAKDAWADLHDQLLQKNAPCIFEIRRAISTHVQGTTSISAYYTTIKGYCDELLSYRHIFTYCCSCMSSLQSILDEDYLMDFLQGLNDSYATVRSQLLLMDPLPSRQQGLFLASSGRMSTFHL